MTEVAFKLMPVSGPITQNFGDMYSGYPHRGVDLGVITGTPIYAPADGVSCWFLNSSTRWKDEVVKSFGEAVCIDHGGDKIFRYSLYAHMSRVLVQEGDTIKAGDLIGYSGNTGVSTGPHLHWQLCKYNTFPVNFADSADPLLYMEADMTKDETAALIEEMIAAKLSEGSLVSSTTALPIVAQIVGSETNTYTEKAALKTIEGIRTAIGDLPPTPAPRVTTTAIKEKSS